MLKNIWNVLEVRKIMAVTLFSTTCAPKKRDGCFSQSHCLNATDRLAKIDVCDHIKNSRHALKWTCLLSKYS